MESSRIRIRQLIDEWFRRGKTKTDLARKLFPKQKDPLRYLNLVLEGKRNISVKSKYYKRLYNIWYYWIKKRGRVKKCYQVELYYKSKIDSESYDFNFILFDGLTKKQAEEVANLLMDNAEEIAEYINDDIIINEEGSTRKDYNVGIAEGNCYNGKIKMKTKDLEDFLSFNGVKALLE